MHTPTHFALLMDLARRAAIQPVVAAPVADVDSGTTGAESTPPVTREM